MSNLHNFELYLSGDIGISIQGVRLVVQGIRNNTNITTIKCKIKSSNLEERKLKKIMKDIAEIKKKRTSLI